MKILKTILKLAAGLLALLLVAAAIVLSYDSGCVAPTSDGDPDGESMVAVRYRCYGPPEVLSLERVEKPTPEADQLLVEVRAAGVNPLDWHFMRGKPYFMRLMSGLGAPDDPRLGRDFSGTVVAVGPAVTRFQVGDAVFGGAGGAFGQYVLVREPGAVAAKPDNISFEQAGSVAIAAVTALQAVRDEGRLVAGERVLINGASGGVGTFAVQIAKTMGAEVTGVSSARNHGLLRSLGADRVIDYKARDYTASGETYDLIIDMIGNHSPLANSRILNPSGRYVIVGGKKGDWLGPAIGLLSAALVSPWTEPELISLMATLSGDDLTDLAGLMASGAVTPVIDRSFPLEEIREAIRYSESGRARGKIVIDRIQSAAL